MSISNGHLLCNNLIKQHLLQILQMLFLMYNYGYKNYIENTMRLSIEITPEQHQYLKAAAALKGESIKDYVLKRTLPDIEGKKALEELENFFTPRIDAARNGEISSRTVDDIFDEVVMDEAK